MKIILSGIKTLGIELCARLQDEGHEVILIERELPRIRYSLDTKDIQLRRHQRLAGGGHHGGEHSDRRHRVR